MHSNTIENVFSVFKRGMVGVYQHCGEAHLHRYLAEFDFRYNRRAAMKVSDTERHDQLLDIGTPEDWLDEVKAWTEEEFFERSAHLPAEVSEALLDYAATGMLPERRPVEEVATTPFEHPDTLRRVKTIESSDDLRLALDFPWDKWSVFLHPSQREVVQRNYGGPARVTGTAGTGKTIVALHRAARAVREDTHSRVLLTTFSRPLANSLRAKLGILLSGDTALLDRVSVASFEDAATDLYQLSTGRRPVLASGKLETAIAERAISETGYADLPLRFVLAEWRQVVDPWSVMDQDAYMAVPRIGRRNRLGGKQRDALWPVFEAMRKLLANRATLTLPQLYAAVRQAYEGREAKPYTHIIVVEAQDLGVPELRMLAALATGPNALFFAGDIGQRIFQLPFSWSNLGIDIRGRSSSLKVNYRMSRQIREAADKLLPALVRDADGHADDRTGAQSVFEGPMPSHAEFPDEAAEEAYVAQFLLAASTGGIAPAEIGVFVRSAEQLRRARNAVELAGMTCRQLTERIDDVEDCVSVGTMHFAKGLEYRAVAVMACDDEELPLQSRVDTATNEDELREIFETERSLLYVACTRARDRLSLSGVQPVSEFLGDLQQALARQQSSGHWGSHDH